MTTTLIQGRHGKFLVPVNDQYVGQSLLAYGEFSYLEFELFEDLIESAFVVVEVGANIGAHTVGLSALVPEGSVLAFEPQSFCYEFLETNININSIRNVTTFDVALGKYAQQMYAPTYSRDAFVNWGGISLGARTRNSEAVSVVRGSSLVPWVDFLKVDVEGMEQEVLEGLEETVIKAKPILYIENDRPEKSASLVKYCWSLGYGLYWHIPPLYNPDNFNKNTFNMFPNIHSFNMVGLPVGKTINLPPITTLEHPLEARNRH